MARVENLQKWNQAQLEAVCICRKMCHSRQLILTPGGLWLELQAPGDLDLYLANQGQAGVKGHTLEGSNVWSSYYYVLCQSTHSIINVNVGLFY